MNGEPFIRVLALGELDSEAQIPGSQRCFCILAQLVLFRALRNVLAWLEGPCLSSEPRL